MKWWKKYLFLILSLSVFLFFFAKPIIFSKEHGREEQLNHNQGDFLSVNVTDAEVRALYTETKVKKMVTEKIDGYELWRDQAKLGKLILHQYQLSNGDLYYLLRYLPVSTAKKNVHITLPINIGDRFEYRHIRYPEGLDFTKSVWAKPEHGKLGKRLPTTSVYIDSDEGSFFISYPDLFLLQDKAVKQEKFEQAVGILPTSSGITYSLPQTAGYQLDQWGIISNQPLVDWQNEIATTDLRIADFNRVRKWGLEGPFYVTPLSYTPSSPTSFYMNPAHHIGEKFLRSTGAQFFEDMAIVSLYTGVRSQNSRGYWYMTNQSNWIFNDYGIPSTYYDTRFSTDAALFLLKGYHVYGEREFLQGAIRYGDFLVDFAHNHHFSTQNGGYLVWDYGHDHVEKPVNHSSLNHLVTEMNFLYELYLVMEKLEYLEVAEKMRLAVQDTHLKWQRDNGDLWYAYLPDGTYGLDDYPLLTLRDLRYSQQLIEKVSGQKDPAFTHLINVKESYLKEKNLPLY